MAQQEWIVWGRREDHASGQWIKLAGGTLRECAHEEAFRRTQGWDTRLRTPGNPALSAGDLAPLPLDEPVNVPADPDVEPQPYDMPSPEADALDRIADLYLADLTCEEALSAIGYILLETGRGT